jgi:hypothetical protein
MLIRNYKLIVPLFAFLCLGSTVSAQTADQFGDEPIVSKSTSFDSEPEVSSQIQDKLQQIELQKKVISSLPISLDIKTDAIEIEGIFLETAKSAMASPATLLLAKLEQLQADLKSSPIDTLTVETPTVPAIPLNQSINSLSTHMAQTIERLNVSNARAKRNARAKSVSEFLAQHKKNRDLIETAEISKVVEGEVTAVLSVENNIGLTSENSLHEVPSHEVEQPINSPNLVAQSSSTPSNSTDEVENLDQMKQELKLDPMVVAAQQRTYPPALTFGIPSAFGANWGDFFIGASGATAGKARAGEVDGSISTGFGIGDSDKLIGMTFSYNLGSIKNFGSNGTFDLQGHRNIYHDGITSVAIAAGWSAFAQYGNEGVTPSSAWGTVTTYSLLQPDNPVNKLPLLLSLGVGGGYYRQDPASTGVFGGIGLQVAPQLGVGLQWSGVGLNLGLSFVPVPTIPLTIVATGADLTNNSPGGTVFVLSVNYGFNFLPPTQ